MLALIICLYQILIVTLILIFITVYQLISHVNRNVDFNFHNSVLFDISY